jgi:hypothetical protein
MTSVTGYSYRRASIIGVINRLFYAHGEVDAGQNGIVSGPKSAYEKLALADSAADDVLKTPCRRRGGFD